MLRHPEAERHYFAEYLELVQQGNLNYYSELAYDRYFLQPNEKDDTLKRYISTLIEHAQKRDLTAALCFCRSPMRSAWMKENFGGLHIALVRNPLDQWESFELGDYFVSRVVLTFHNLKRQHSFISSQLGIWPFREYSMQLISPNPNVQPSHREIEDQLFRMFFVIWLASLNQSAAVSELILDFDRLSDDEEWRIHISDRLKEFGLSVNLEDCKTPRRVFPDNLMDGRMKTISSVVAGLKEAKPSFLMPLHHMPNTKLSALTSGVLREFVA